MLGMQETAARTVPARRHADQQGAPQRAIDLAVKEALRLQFQWGTVNALEYLRRQGVAPDIVQRILDPRGERRRGDIVAAARQPG